MFFNTGISTYLWIVTNRKPAARKKKVQLIDASQSFVKMPRSLGNKRNLIGDGRENRPPHIAEITKLYDEFCGADLRSAGSRRLRLPDSKSTDGLAEQAPTGRPEVCPTSGPRSKIFDNLDFGYRRITVERPLRLAFEVTEKRLEKIATGKTDIKPLDKLPQETRTWAVETLTPHLGRPVCKNRDEFAAWLAGVVPNTETFGSDERALVMDGLSFKDETADPIIRLVAEPQPDKKANAVDLNRRGLWLAWQAMGGIRGRRRPARFRERAAQGED